MRKNAFNLHLLTNDDLDALTDNVTDLLDRIKLLTDNITDLIPADVVNGLIELEAECCIQLDARGLTIMPDMADDETFAPENFAWVTDTNEPDPASLTAFADFVDSLNFDDDLEQ